MLQDIQVKHVILIEHGPLGLRGFDSFNFGDRKKDSTTIVLEVEFDKVPNRSHILFTSGSTGKPKPVQIQAKDRVAEFNNPGFDLSLFDIWVTLIAGATIVVIPRHVTIDPNALSLFLMEHGVTIIVITAALFETIAFSFSKAFQTLRHVLTAGDVANKETIKKVLQEGPPQHLWNTYGPTECTTLVTMFEVTLDETNRDRISIGSSVTTENAEISASEVHSSPPDTWLGHRRLQSPS
ncbi:hypothetical protein BBP40_009351 [Aspergillus hancockii]|nr:hypothetical protein BBP40_009351 [Aspergillus hancockii]